MRSGWTKSLSVAATAWLLAAPGLALAQQKAHETTLNPGAQAAEEDSKNSKRTLLFPIVISDPTNGTGLGGGVLKLYRLNPEDTASQDSRTVFYAYLTTSKSWSLGFDQDFAFGEDRYRSRTRGRFGLVNNRFTYPDIPSDVVFGQRRDMVTTDFLVRTWGQLYLGGNYRFASTRFSYDRGTAEEQQISEALLTQAGASTTTESGIGVLLAYDSRDHDYTPTRGIHAEGQFLTFRSWLGSDDDFASTDLFLNAYWPVAKHQVLAFRVRWRQAMGSVPYTGQSSFGGIDLRGYPEGKYRGDGTIAAQAEYRFPIKGRIGGVVFAGTGRVYGNDETLGANRTLPSGGAGLRFLLFKDRGSNVGIDFAKGRFGDSGVHLRFSEAF